MDGFDVSPLTLQVFYDQTPVAVLRCSLTAEQDGWYFKDLLFNSFFNPSVPQQSEKTLFILGPLPFLPFVHKQLLGWS